MTTQSLPAGEAGTGGAGPGPGAATLNTALSLAARAPSVHNTQPWRWRVEFDSGEGARLHLFVDPILRLPSIDPEGRGLILSCGAALHHAVIALAALGWRSRVHRLPGGEDHLACVEVYRGDPEPMEVSLAAAIPRRRSDRRFYSRWPVPAADVGLMGARAARGGVALRRVDAIDRLNAVVSQAVREHGADADYLTELADWSGRRGTSDGVPSANTTAVDERSATLPARRFAEPALTQPAGAAPEDDRAQLLALGTREDDLLAHLRAGEATSVVLLTATALGLASCPVTEPLELPDTRSAVRRDVFGNSGFPQMLIRVGWAPINADPLPATPRRALADIVEYSRGLGAWKARARQERGGGHRDRLGHPGRHPGHGHHERQQREVCV